MVPRDRLGLVIDYGARAWLSQAQMRELSQYWLGPLSTDVESVQTHGAADGVGGDDSWVRMFNAGVLLLRVESFLPLLRAVNATRLRHFHKEPTSTFRCCEQPLLNALLASRGTAVQELGRSFNTLGSSLCAALRLLPQLHAQLRGGHDAKAEAKALELVHDLDAGCVLHLTRGVQRTCVCDPTPPLEKEEDAPFAGQRPLMGGRPSSFFTWRRSLMPVASGM
eukprot:scaffold7378_cov410-Prasinococcus_capsulatus_cf.AAC.12